MQLVGCFVLAVLASRWGGGFDLGIGLHCLHVELQDLGAGLYFQVGWGSSSWGDVQGIGTMGLVIWNPCLPTMYHHRIIAHTSNPTQTSTTPISKQAADKARLG